MARKLATVVALVLLAGCESFGNGKWDREEIWLAVGAVVVTGAIIASQEDSSRSRDLNECFRPCPGGRCAEPILC